MIGRIVSWIVLFALGVLLLTLIVANRHTVQFALDPFQPNDPTIYLRLPMWTYLLVMFVLGALAGWLVTLVGQGKWRRLARIRTQEAMRWKGEADRLARERDASASTSAGAPGSPGQGGRKLLAIARR